jgi:hypothetical protein
MGLVKTSGLLNLAYLDGLTHHRLAIRPELAGTSRRVVTPLLDQTDHRREIGYFRNSFPFETGA